MRKHTVLSVCRWMPKFITRRIPRTYWSKIVGKFKKFLPAQLIILLVIFTYTYFYYI